MPMKRVSTGGSVYLWRPERDEHVRHTPLLQVLPDGAVGLIAEAGYHREDLVLLHQPLRYLYRVRRVIVIVADYELDLAPVHASLHIVDVVEIGAHPVAYGRIGSGGASAERKMATEQDLRVCNTGNLLRRR